MTTLVLVSSRYGSPSDLGVFAGVADTVASMRLGARALPVETGEDLLDRLSRLRAGEIDHLVVAGHGGPTWLLHPRHGVGLRVRGRHSVAVSELAAEIARLGVPLVSLAACLCSRSPRWFLRAQGRSLADWGPRAYLPGGEASFSARLRDHAWWYGHDLEVRGHRSAGHATGNPLLAAHIGPAASPCETLFGIAFPGVEPTRARRRAWVSVVRGRLAERWLLGDDLVVGEIRRLV